MKKLIVIQVPNKSKDHFINNVGCLRFQIGSSSNVIDPRESGVYLEKNKHKIIGLSTNNDVTNIVVGFKK